MPAATALDLEAFREVALRAGYGEPIVEAARLRRQALPAREALPASLRRAWDSDALPVLVALLTLGDVVDRDDAERALHPFAVDDLAHAGLLELHGDEVRCPFHAAHHDDLLLLGDGRGETAHDFVAPSFGPSLLTAAIMPRGQRRTMLDLGTGSGILALLAARHCERVVGVDVNRRALMLAALNARINGVRNAQWRAGSWLEPVAGERFDLITCNPPYVISPDHDFTYRDSGMPPAALIEQLCHDIPNHLEDDGVAVVLGMWPHAEREDWAATPHAWVRASGCDALVLCMETIDALDDAVRWNTPPARRLGPAAREETIARWSRFHDAAGTGAVSFGAVILRRTDREPWALVTRASAEPGGHAFRQVERLIAGNDLVRSGADLLARRYAVPDGLSVTQRFARDADGWIARMASVTVSGGLGLTASIDPDALDLLFRLDGNPPPAELAPALRELLTTGMLDITTTGDEPMDRSNRTQEPEPIEDLELDAKDAEQVAGGTPADFAATSNIMKSKHDAAQNAISNAR